MTLIRPPVMPMATNMRHVVQLVLPLTQIVATLSRPLSWSDFVNLLPLNSLDKHERQPGDMSELAPNALQAELRALIASSRQRLAGAVNAKLTRLYWAVGQRLRTEVLGDASAGYGAKLLDQLGQQLANEFGRGFESHNLRRMVKFVESFTVKYP